MSDTTDDAAVWKIDDTYFRKGIWFECDYRSILLSHCSRSITHETQQLPSQEKYYCFNCKENIQEGHHGCQTYRGCQCWRNNKDKIFCDVCFNVCKAFKTLRLDVCAIEYEGQMYLVDETMKVYECTAKIDLPIGVWDSDSQQLVTNEELHTQGRVSLTIRDGKDIQTHKRFMGWNPEEMCRMISRPCLNSGVIRLQDAIERALFDERQCTNAQLVELETRLQTDPEPPPTQSNLESLQHTVQQLTEDNAALKAELRTLQQQFNTFSLTLMPSTSPHSNPFDALE